jgi:tRNA(adenine34) deaminase
MSDAHDAWDALSAPWQACLSEAWASWRAGSAGVGAIVVDDGGDIVARGRNRMLDANALPGVLAGSAIAHAEMNALARLPIGSCKDLTLYTSFEPCLMCASTIIQLQMPRVRYAAADPVFDGLHDWFARLPYAADRIPERDSLGGPIGAFAHVLHLSWLAFWDRTAPFLDAHARLAPGHLELAARVASEGGLWPLAARGADVADAIDALWDDLRPLA